MLAYTAEYRGQQRANSNRIRNICKKRECMQTLFIRVVNQLHAVYVFEVYLVSIPFEGTLKFSCTQSYNYIRHFPSKHNLSKWISALTFLIQIFGIFLEPAVVYIHASSLRLSHLLLPHCSILFQLSINGIVWKIYRNIKKNKKNKTPTYSCACTSLSTCTRCKNRDPLF